MCETYHFDEVFHESACMECIYTDPSLIFHQVQCLFSCPDGKGRSSLNSQTCDITCPSNCVQCDFNGDCVLCQDDYLYMNGGCVNLCPDYYTSDGIRCLPCAENCVRCQLDGACVECESGLSLSASGYCHDPECPYSEKPDSSSPCATCISPCSTCTEDPTECTSCIEGDYVYIPQTSDCMSECNEH